ncbi:MAG: glycosyltransferase family 4 protein [Deltaproteobacteria bacterium CG_4_9_14_3_um_filter_65_9]|nr:MAG: glycosyltransferase family 4 protein [Deltaproteobacteria bacterium CG_4_9_14_3_um_filter_65_9]
MNILVINYEYPPIGGGGGVLCKDISEGIVAKGHRITVVTSHYGSLQKSENLHGVDIFRVPVLMRKKQTVASMTSMISFVPMCIWKVKELMKSDTYDLINTHFAIPSGPAGQYVSRRYNIPNVLSILGGDIIDPSKFLSPHNTFPLKQTVRKMLYGADRVVAESTDIKRNAQKYYGFDRQIDIVPLGIYPNVHPVKTREALGLPPDKFIFVTIGRLVKRKNLEDLLHIFRDAQEIFPSILLVIGDGPEKENIENLAKQLGISGEIRLLGRVSDEEKFQYLAVSDVYLSTAIHEGFGIVFLEAMECGLPVLSYDRGGQTDFLREGKTGYLIELGNKGNFVSKLKELLNSDSLRAEVRAHNKNYVKEFYIEHVAEKYISIFNEVAASRKS